MTFEIVLVLLIVVGAIVLFAIDRVPVEATSLAVVGALAASHVLTAEEAFAGFSNDTVIFIFALLAMTEGLAASGVMRHVATALAPFGRLGRHGFLLGMMSMVAVMSAFVSNTATTAALLPVVVRGARSTGLSRSLVLMPLAFASMLGGMGFLYGTSTNLVVSERLHELGLGAIGIVELTRVGVPLALIGIVLLLFLAPRLLRRSPSTEEQGQRRFVAELRIDATSPLAEKRVRVLERRLGVDVIALLQGRTPVRPSPEQRMGGDTRLIVTGLRRDVMALARVRGVTLSGEGGNGMEKRGRDQLVAEVVIPETSTLAGQSVAEAGFAERHGVRLVAHYRHPALHLPVPHAPAASLSRTRLEPGDTLLLAGAARRIRALTADRTFLILVGEEGLPRTSHARAALAAAIFAGALVVGSFGIVPLSVAGIAGVLLMFATGCLDPRLAFRIDWRVVLSIGSMLALGVAMEKSGAGQLLGDLAAHSAGVVGPRGVLFGLMTLTVLLSVPMSNQAAALVMLPVALSAAIDLGVNERAFAMAIALSASCSFVTPLEPSCMIVYGPGRYRFADFLRVGGPLTAAMLVMLTVLVPWAWPL